MKRRKGKGKFKRTGRAFCGEEQPQDPELWSEEDFAWWSKGKRARKAGQKATKAFTRVAFALTSQIKLQARTTPRTKTKERTRKARARKEFSLNLDFQPLKHSMKKDMAMLGNLTTGLPAIGLTIP